MLLSDIFLLVHVCQLRFFYHWGYFFPFYQNEIRLKKKHKNGASRANLTQLHMWKSC